MGTTDWIAVYAALVATAGLGWQAWERRQRRRPQVQPQLRAFTVDGRPGLVLDVRNRGDHSVRVRTASFGRLLTPLRIVVLLLMLVGGIILILSITGALEKPLSKKAPQADTPEGTTEGAE